MAATGGSIPSSVFAVQTRRDLESSQGCNRRFRYEFRFRSSDKKRSRILPKLKRSQFRQNSQSSQQPRFMDSEEHQLVFRRLAFWFFRNRAASDDRKRRSGGFFFSGVTDCKQKAPASLRRERNGLLLHDYVLEHNDGLKTNTRGLKETTDEIFAIELPPSKSTLFDLRQGLVT
uniref:Uncharacterized protein n=1 Tax=Nelumbo nucifera TaxID=4432 RepID=A0A822XFP9_NELNU|nr:TPA_asm: hypothetical protein HUJ06_020673 [Nelumbo nucifera]